MITSAHSPKWVNPENTLIDLIAVHSEYGEIPFGADPNDVEPHGRDLYARALAGEFGPIAPYEPPVKSAEQLLAEQKTEARQYLQSTDWYVTRLAETGTPIPESISDKRTEYRQFLSDNKL